MIQKSPFWMLRWMLVPLALLPVGCGDPTGTGRAGPLRLVSSFPLNGARNVSVHSDVEIRFSAELDETSIAEAVKLLDGNREVLTWIYLKKGRTVLLRPTEPLDFGTRYRVLIKATLRTRDGRVLSEGRSREFTTHGLAPPAPVMDSLRLTLSGLAHDSMRGRGSGTEDELRAAAFMDERFRAYGLDPPLGGSPQAFQAFSPRLSEVVSSQNVLAAIPGSGSLAHEWLVLGAHYDHIGVRAGPDGTPAINNGADDNASGASLILELARVLHGYLEVGGMPVEDRRSVLFAGWGAEEVGLLGSCHYARHEAVVPLGRTRALMNFDMVGRMRDGVVMVRGYESWDSWAPMVQNANHPALMVHPLPPGGGNSDFVCFREEGIPFLYFHTGLHDQYHTPADDVELINFPGLVDIGQVSLRVLTRLMVMEGAR